jgi:hypothetical protein
MELWQMDVVGGFALSDGSSAKALTVVAVAPAASQRYLLRQVDGRLSDAHRNVLVSALPVLRRLIEAKR